jgi:uncharacterized membrane protein
MLEFLTTTEAQAVLSVATLLVLMMVGYYVVRKFRDHTTHDQRTPNDMLTNFREMHQQGDISDKEFRKIKSVLGPQIQEELKDTEDDA